MKKFIEVLLYSNIYIGICAACITAVNQIWYGYEAGDIFYTGFVLFGTIVLYGAHRLIGVSRIEVPQGRFATVQSIQHIIVLVTGVSGLGSIICLTQLPWTLWIDLLPAIVGCILYVSPIFPGKRRLRDLPFVKLFVLAGIWSYLTAYIPMIQKITPNYLDYGLVFERFIFIVAITLPFDIRDIVVDTKQSVSTLATSWGVKGSKIAAQIALFAGVMSLVSVTLEQEAFYNSAVACIPAYLLAYLLIAFSNQEKSDRYFLVGLDGTMILMLIGALVMG